MVRAEGDGGKGVDHIDQQTRQRTAQQTDPVGAGNPVCRLRNAAVVGDHQDGLLVFPGCFFSTKVRRS